MATIPVKDYQTLFIEMLRTALPPNQTLVVALSDLLEISTDSAYRRLRCETEFSLSEVSKLCSHYHISFDALCAAEPGAVNFRYHLLGKDPQNLRAYLEGIHASMKHLYDAKEREVYYAAEDIPLFYLFRYPGLTAFKLFYWMRSIMSVPELDNCKYDPAFPEELLGNLGTEINNLYNHIPSVEIWNEGTFSKVLKWIEFYHVSGLFVRSDQAYMLCEELLELLANIRKNAENSSKLTCEAKPNNFTLYNTDVDIGNVLILARAGTLKYVFVRHSTFNTLETTSPAFCQETEQWLEGLIRKSTMISGGAEKHRNIFFRNMEQHVRAFMDKLNP